MYISIYIFYFGVPRCPEPSKANQAGAVFPMTSGKTLAAKDQSRRVFRTRLVETNIALLIRKQILVGGFNPSENMKVNWDDYSQYMGK